VGTNGGNAQSQQNQFLAQSPAVRNNQNFNAQAATQETILGKAVKQRTNRKLQSIFLKKLTKADESLLYRFNSQENTRISA
jgi:hypothetical protein